jgi:hypothetical protein
MSDYTTMRWVVATKRAGRVFQFYFAADNLDEALAQFNSADGCDQVRIYNRAQWNGSRSNYRYHKNLVERTDPIPASIGMWVINQAGSDSL